MRPYQLPETAPQSPIYASIEGLARMSVPVHVLRRNKAVLAIDHTQPIQQRSKNTAPVLWLDLLKPTKISIEVLVVSDFVVRDSAGNR
jgi:hypothetical protein